MHPKIGIPRFARRLRMHHNVNFRLIVKHVSKHLFYFLLYEQGNFKPFVYIDIRMESING